MKLVSQFKESKEKFYMKVFGKILAKNSHEKFWISTKVTDNGFHFNALIFLGFKSYFWNPTSDWTSPCIG